jgi:hypothetical protein
MQQCVPIVPATLEDKVRRSHNQGGLGNIGRPPLKNKQSRKQTKTTHTHTQKNPGDVDQR